MKDRKIDMKNDDKQKVQERNWKEMRNEKFANDTSFWVLTLNRIVFSIIVKHIFCTLSHTFKVQITVKST
jgi:uncharacterized membrane protein YagU involved in acid resistance